jgi:hypothetical protein
MTAPIPRRRRPRLSFTERRWLLSGRPGAIVFLEAGKWAQRLWKEYGAEITQRHIRKWPGTRPANWWTYDAPTRRDSSTESQLAYLQRLDLLTDEERKRVPHVRPRLRRSTLFPSETMSPPAQPVGTTGPNSPPPYHPLSGSPTPPPGWQFILDDETGRVELVRAGSR